MQKRKGRRGRGIAMVLTLLVLSGGVIAGNVNFSTKEKPQMDGQNKWKISALYTVGETVDGYQPVGILDGTGAYEVDKKTVRVLVSHELNSDDGKTYKLANGLNLTGARISYFDVDSNSRKIKAAGPAYDTVYDRKGKLVTAAKQINETTSSTEGFDRFCSSRLVEEGQFGFEDTIFFANEESGVPYHPHGGTVWALDVENETLWACPSLGRGAWENVTPLDTDDDDYVALLMGDDTQGAPLYLWVGKKNSKGDFLARNGLSDGTLYVWVADNGDVSPEDFNGDGETRDGTFVEIDPRDENEAGEDGYDADGWLDNDTLRKKAINDLDAFAFSRPEDLHNDPDDGTRAAFASTGRGGLFPSDDWGTLYIVDVDFEDIEDGDITAEIEILYDGDDQAKPDSGLRSPDNLVWADDGYIYVQEDRSTKLNVFGGTSGREASIFQVDPDDGSLVRIAEIDRSVVVPSGTTDNDPNDLGDWESSGVLDLTSLMKTNSGKTLLLVTVQAHSVRDGIIGKDGLEQGGQLIFVEGRPD